MASGLCLGRGVSTVHYWNFGHLFLLRHKLDANSQSNWQNQLSETKNFDDRDFNDKPIHRERKIKKIPSQQKQVFYVV